MAFSENLQFLRTQQNLTQEQLAEAMDVSRQSVSKWESGASFPEMDTILKLCDLFSVSLDTLLRGDAAAEAQADTAGYDKHMNTFTWQVTLSIVGIIAGVALMVGALALGLPEELSTVLFLLILTIAVVVLIAGGIQHDNFCKRYPVIPDFYTQEEKEAAKERSEALHLETLTEAYRSLGEAVRAIQGPEEVLGLSHLPDGQAYYIALVQAQTGTDMTAEELQEYLAAQYTDSLEELLAYLQANLEAYAR